MRNLDELALDLINRWEARSYLAPAQRKAALQCAIVEALKTERREQRERDAVIAHTKGNEIAKGYTTQAAKLAAGVTGLASAAAILNETAAP
jgi:hypothetical protein